MRTRTLLLSAALVAAGLATSMAQTVYSVNAVGYVNVKIPNGFSIIANPLDAGTTNNTVVNLFAGQTLPNQFRVYKFVNGNYQINTWLATQTRWSDTAMTLVPGEGAFVSNPGAAITNTFVGTVMSGSLTNPLPNGFALVSSQVPQAGKVQADLGLVPTGLVGAASFTVYQFNNAINNYASAAYRLGSWPSAGAGEPTIAVGEGFFVNNPAPAFNWTRNFSFQN